MSVRLRECLCVATAALVLQFGSVGAQTSGSAPAPTHAAELEFWRSTQAIGTKEAYQAYLDAFPNGLFAPLATAAMKRTQPAASAAGGSGFLPDDLKALLSRPPRSTAVTAQVGEVYFGPGMITVGWLGAKKQLVLPQGAWVLVSAVDYSLAPAFDLTGGGFGSIAMTSLSFAQLDDRRLGSLIQFTFNSKTVGPSARWDDECTASVSRAGNPWVTSEGGNHQCNELMSSSGLAVARTPGVDDLHETLRLLRVSVPDKPSTLLRSISGSRRGYLRVERVDFGNRRRGPAQPITWAEQYARAIAKGFAGAYSSGELVPNNGNEVATQVFSLDN